MSPQVDYNSHGPHRKGIPANLVQKWQSSPRRVVKPQVRRPKTACERCRTAKVKCHGDGRHECTRCNSRGLPCRYMEFGPSPDPDATPTGSDPDQTTTLEEIRIDADFNVNHTHELADNNTASSPQLRDSSVAWTTANHLAGAIEQQQYMDWATVDPAATLSLPEPFPSALTPTSEQQPSLSSLGLFPFITSTTADNLAWQDQLASQSCQCRAGLAQLMPSARAALRERRLDGVFRVTSDVIQCCEGIAGCETCSVNCTDLICIMAVFQEADVCFDYVAKGDIDGAIKVNIGSYEVEIGVRDRDAEQFRRLLVTQLVRRALSLLDSISARGQDMLKALDPECRLGRVNIDYLEAVIRNSRENLHHAMEALEGAGTVG